MKNARPVGIFRFRIYPNKEEEGRLLNTMLQCRKMYNMLLAEANKHKLPKMGELQAKIPIWKKEDPSLATAYSQCLAYEKDKLFHNIWGLAATKKRKKGRGKLRFKSEARFSSFRYPQYPHKGWKILETNTRLKRLHLSKIGDIPICISREIVGNMKTVTIKHAPSGKWYATITTRIDKIPAEKTTSARTVGIDLGIPYFATDTSGLEVPNPMYLKKDLKKMRRADRRLKRKQPGSNNYKKQQLERAKMHEKVANRRTDFMHKLSRYYVDNYDIIITEDLNIKDMLSKAYPSTKRGIQDSPWYKFNRMLAYKAEGAGCTHIMVRPQFTSQLCSRCGTLVPKGLRTRKHECPKCGYYAGRDYNASQNILQRGLGKVGLPKPEHTPMDTKASTPSILAGHVLVDEVGSHVASDQSI